jgi:16S rRNA (cytidine1402-2'-O)-methyltransferase
VEDLSPRARTTLAAVPLIAAEDTRHAGLLLTRLGISARLVSLHEHNESQRLQELLAHLQSGNDLALVSDAGTPLVSDPGYRLLKAARDADLRVSPIPGPCAAIAALSVAGLPADHFRVEGFLPARAEARRARLLELARCAETLVWYESVHRIGEMLAELVEVFGGERPAAVGREITKLHETIYRGTLAELATSVLADATAVKGEYTVVVAGAPDAVPGEAELARVVAVLAAELPASQAASLAARLTGSPKREAYRLAVAVKGDG